MSDFEIMTIKGLLREIEKRLCRVRYETPDYSMVDSLEEVKEYINKVQHKIADIIEAEE